MNVFICASSMDQRTVADLIRRSGQHITALLIDDKATEPRIEDMRLDDQIRHGVIPLFELKNNYAEACKEIEDARYFARERRRDDPWRKNKKDGRYK